MNRRFTHLAILTLGMALLGGCAADTGAGAIELALTTTDSEGAVYRLPAYASLSLRSGTFSDSFSLAGDGTSVRIEVPPGTYEASMGDEGSQVALERRVGAGPVETVLATLVTPMPIAIDVVEGGTASIEVELRVPDRGTITFEEAGAIDVSIDVSRGAPTGYDIRSYASLFQVATTGWEVPESIESRFPETGDTRLPLALEARLTGDFVRTSSRTLCAPLEVSRLTTTDGTGLAEVLAEATAAGSSARLCLDHTYVTIQLERSGAATTAMALETGASEHLFRVTLYTHLAESVYEDATLDLDALLSPHLVTLQVMTEIYGGPAGEPAWSHRADFQGNESGLVFGATY